MGARRPTEHRRAALARSVQRIGPACTGPDLSATYAAMCTPDQAAFHVRLLDLRHSSDRVLRWAAGYRLAHFFSAQGQLLEGDPEEVWWAQRLLREAFELIPVAYDARRVPQVDRDCAAERLRDLVQRHVEGELSPKGRVVGAGEEE